MRLFFSGIDVKNVFNAIMLLFTKRAWNLHGRVIIYLIRLVGLLRHSCELGSLTLLGLTS